MILLPDLILEILQKLDSAGFHSYVVGGSIRDLLLGNSPKDWDICTPATPQQIKVIFPNHHTLGEKYGTIGVKTKEGIIQITTFRGEKQYKDFRHPEIYFIDNLEEDLRRRDFSINAIAYHPQDGIIDPYHGIKDLNHQVLRCIDEPKIRFQEDALRILRLIRFVSTLGFQAEQQTYQDALLKSSLLKNIGQERIRDEVLLILQGKNLSKAFKDYRPIFHLIFPELTKAPKHNITNPALLFAFLLPKKEDIAALKRFKFDRVTIKRTSMLLSFKHIPIKENKIAIKKLLNQIGYDHFLALLELQKLLGHNIKPLYKLTQDIMIADECFTLKDLKINGLMLKKLGIYGEKIGKILLKLLEEVIEERLANQQEELLKRALELI